MVHMERGIGPNNQMEVAAALTDYAHSVRNSHIADGQARSDDEFITDRLALGMAEQAALATLRQALIRNIGPNDTLEVWATDPSKMYAVGYDINPNNIGAAL